MAGGAAPGQLTAPDAAPAQEAAEAPAGGSRPRPPVAADGWTLDWAHPGDDAGIRALLRRSVVPGSVRVAFTREPSDAAGAGVAGSTELTIVARNRDGVAGIGRCTIHALHRNGVPQRVGYLGALRLLPGLPASPRLLRDGYRALADEACAHGVQGFVTAIADDNVRARRVLEQGRRFGLPSYRPIASLVTLVAPVCRRSFLATRATADAHDRDGQKDFVDPDELMGFLRTHGAEAQLTLAWDRTRWSVLALHGLTPAHFVVVRRSGAIAAAAAIWDQRAFRQTIVDGYDNTLALWRPAINVLQRVRGQPLLPAPGAPLVQGAVFAATVPDQRDWPALWARLHQRARSASLDWLALTRDAQAPELAPLRRLSGTRTYETTLYDVAWRDRACWTEGWDGRLFAPEAGLL